MDWKRKLTSRKFWAAVVSFVTMLLIFLGKDAGTTEQVAALIMAGASLIAYIIGEGLADSGHTGDTDDTPYNFTVTSADGSTDFVTVTTQDKTEGSEDGV